MVWETIDHDMHDFHDTEKIVEETPDCEVICRFWCNDCEEPFATVETISECQKEGCSNKPTHEDTHYGETVAVCSDCVKPRGSRLESTL